MRNTSCMHNQYICVCTIVTNSLRCNIFFLSSFFSSCPADCNCTHNKWRINLSITHSTRTHTHIRTHSVITIYIFFSFTVGIGFILSLSLFLYVRLVYSCARFPHIVCSVQCNDNNDEQKKKKRKKNSNIETN